MRLSISVLGLCLGLCLFLSACEKPDKELEFRDIRNVKLNKVEGSEAFLNADALFYNPNKQSMMLRSVDLDVFLDGKKIAHIDQEKKIKIPSIGEFSVPLEVKFNIKDAGLLSNIFGFLGGKKFDTHYVGHIKASFKGIPFKVPVDHHEALRLR